MVDLFYELIQVAVGNRSSLSRVPTAAEWGELYNLATRQALTGVCFVGLQRLQPTETLNIPETLRLRWLGMAAKIQRRNQVMNAECAEVCKMLAHDGFYVCVLKGQGNLMNYPEELRAERSTGDIDLLLRPIEGIDIAVETGHKSVEYFRYFGIRGSIEYCLLQSRLLNKEQGRVLYHHTRMPWVGSSSVEGHYRATWLNSSLRNLRLQKWLEENMPFGICDAKLGDSVFPIPSASYNAVYQLLHIYKHLFESGIGLRQLLDYYFVLRALHIEQGSLADRTQNMSQWAEGMGMSVRSNAEILHTLSSFGMKRFASAVMYVLQTVFAMPNEYFICQPNEKEGKFLLNEIMMAGNFGKYDDRIARGAKYFMGFKVSGSISHAIEKTKHNLRLLKHYPEEVLWEPFFRVYHWIWRRFELWRY